MTSTFKISFPRRELLYLRKYQKLKICPRVYHGYSSRYGAGSERGGNNGYLIDKYEIDTSTEVL